MAATGRIYPPPNERVLFVAGDASEEERDRLGRLADALVGACEEIGIEVSDLMAVLYSALVNVAVATRDPRRKPGPDQVEAKMLSVYVDLMNAVLEARTPDDARLALRRVNEEMVAFRKGRGVLGTRAAR